MLFWALILVHWLKGIIYFSLAKLVLLLTDLLMQPIRMNNPRDRICNLHALNSS
jgi:hypothetical protein